MSEPNPTSTTQPVAAQASAPEPDEPGIEEDNTNATAIVVIGLVSTVLVLASVLGVTALYEGVVNSFEKERVQGAVYTESEDALVEQYTLLTDEPRVNPPEIGGYAIPIDRAMSLVLAEMQAEQEPAKAQ